MSGNASQNVEKEEKIGLAGRQGLTADRQQLHSGYHKGAHG
jgi:murein DD-endopeptidase MepM/ murein hydrolase activator NlpD